MTTKLALIYSMAEFRAHLIERYMRWNIGHAEQIAKGETPPRVLFEKDRDVNTLVSRWLEIIDPDVFFAEPDNAGVDEVLLDVETTPPARIWLASRE